MPKTLSCGLIDVATGTLSTTGADSAARGSTLRLELGYLSAVVSWAQNLGPLLGSGHAFSANGIEWSEITGAFNMTRPVVHEAGGPVSTVRYASERPKLLLGADGASPTHLYAGSSKGTGYTIVSPLAV